MTRASTGIKGLDDKMEGGFFRDSANLITGRTGTCKTVFGVSFLYKGALEGEPGVYVTTEQREVDVRDDITSMFGWDIDKLVEKKLLTFLGLQPVLPTKSIASEDMGRLVKLYVYDLSEKIINALKKTNAKRCVIDSISFIEMFIKDEYLARAALMQLVGRLKDVGDVTTVFTGTIPETSEALSGGGIVEYIVDTVIKLDFVPVAEEFKRTLTIRKMRRTDHSTFIHPFDITKDGLKVIEIR
jgi:KaiC/GvpD/RAD55 family RecA-like ATPase